MSRTAGVPGENVDTNLNAAGNRSQVTVMAWPKDWYSWTDRTTIVLPDVSNTFDCGTVTPIAIGDAGALVITGDSNAAGAICSLAVVLWDERNNPISVSTGSLTVSTWCQNAAGNYIASSGNSLGAAYLPINVACAAGYNVIVQAIQPGASSYGTVGSVTLATTNGSPTVTGTGTQFLSQVSVGNYLIFSNDGTLTPYQVASIQSNTSLTLSSNIAAAAAGSGQTAQLCTAAFNLHYRLF